MTTTAGPEATAFSVGRVVRLATLLTACGVVYELLIRSSIAGALSLTAAGAVAIINFRWLGITVEQVIQPGRPRFDLRSVARMTGRMAVLGVGCAALLLAPRVDGVAVALGLSTLVVAVLLEGFRWARAGGG